MNPVFIFLVLVGAVILWFLLIKISDYLDEKIQKRNKEKNDNE